MAEPIFAPRSRVPLSEITWSTPCVVPHRGRALAAARDGSVVSVCDDGAIAWRRELGETVTASPVPIALQNRGDVVVLGTHEGRVRALSVTDGAIVWETEVEGVVRATVAVATLEEGDVPRVFVASYGDFVSCLRADDGRVEWTRWLPANVWNRSTGIVSSPLVADVDGDGRLEVVVGNRSWRTYCLDARTGRLRWYHRFDYGVDSTPSLVDLGHERLVVVGTGESLNGLGDNAIVALDGATGRERWRVPCGGGVDGSATVARLPGESAPVVFQTTLADAACVCVDAADGTERWRYRIAETDACTHESGVCLTRGFSDYFTERAVCRSYTMPVVADVDGDDALEVVFGSCNGSVITLDAATGQPKDIVNTGGLVRGSPVLADLDGDGFDELVVPTGSELQIWGTKSRGADWPMFKGASDLAGRTADMRDRAEPTTNHADPATALLAEAALLLEWSLRDLAYFVRARVDRHALEPLGLARMRYRF